VSNIFKRFGLIFFILVIVLITFVYFAGGERKELPARAKKTFENSNHREKTSIRDNKIPVEKKEKPSQPITSKPKRKSPVIICIDPGHQQKAVYLLKMSVQDQPYKNRK
jgi:N-acetylmuramoyl-L-alanine amidase